jgi:hypothetical protein
VDVPTEERKGGAPAAEEAGWSAVERALRGAAADPTNAVWTVHVTGSPGGLVRLRGERVVAVWTTGSPLAIPSPARRGRAGGALARTAASDALYVMAAGRVRDVWVEPGAGAGTVPDPGAEPGVPLDRALAEVRRRQAVPSRSGHEIHPEETFPRPGPRAGAAPAVTPAEARVVDLADGGLTVRDIAFLLDRGVFGVVLDVLALAALGVLAVPPARSGAAPVVPAPRPEPPQARRVVSLLARRRPAAPGEPGDAARGAAGLS